jgi:DNA-binding NtrC family response regulator
LLANHLLNKHAKELNRPGKMVSSELMEVFQRRAWEGNIREMENIIIQGMLFSSEEVIRPVDVGLGNGSVSSGIWDQSMQELPYKVAKEKTLQQFNNAYIGHALSLSKGNITQAAHASGMERQALQQIMRRYAINADKFRE